MPIPEQVLEELTEVLKCNVWGNGGLKSIINTHRYKEIKRFCITVDLEEFVNIFVMDTATQNVIKFVQHVTYEAEVDGVLTNPTYNNAIKVSMCLGELFISPKGGTLMLSPDADTEHKILL